MIGLIKRSLFRLAVGSAAFLMGLGPLDDAFAQKMPDREHAQTPQMSGQRGERDRIHVADQALEGWLVVKLAAGPGLNEVGVEVNDGIATLTGKVATQQDKNRAIWVGSSTPGVASVREQITIDPALVRQRARDIPDLELGKKVAQEIAAKMKDAKADKGPRFAAWRVEGASNRWNLVVDVSDGHVILAGEVPTIDILREAVQAAGDVPGVRTVDSDLQLPLPYGYSGYPQTYGPYYPYLPPEVTLPHKNPSTRARGEQNLSIR